MYSVGPNNQQKFLHLVLVLSSSTEVIAPLVLLKHHIIHSNGDATSYIIGIKIAVPEKILLVWLELNRVIFVL